MKILKSFRKTLVLTFVSIIINAQSTQFDVSAYKQFLESNKNISSSQLLEMHEAGNFKAELNLSSHDYKYFDSITTKYELTEYEKSLINKNGFIVSERLSDHSFGSALLDIFHKDLPVFVSTDAVLHALHMSYDNILKDVELGIIIDKLSTLLEQLHSNLGTLDSKYSAYSEMKTMLKDVDVYLVIASRLLGDYYPPYFSDNKARIDSIRLLVLSEQGAVPYSLFSDEPVLYDFSQFKPRGHYTDEYHPILAKYFRAMMWLGRIELYLLSPKATINPTAFKDLKRQTIDAMLIQELFDISSANEQYQEIEEILKFFIGESDNVTLLNLSYLKDAININSSSELLDSLKLIEFQDTLKNQSFAYQLILSQILMKDPMSPDSIVPASAFLMFGQRFIIDSYVTGSVVFDRIKTCRLFPSTLDPMFALGNDAAAQLLKSELDTYKYAGNLAALRFLIDSYGSDFWNSSIYNMWLNTIRELNPPRSRENLPLFMQTAAFWQEKLNTQLTSWTQLRHDNLLYAKQSYTGGIICSYPYSYVEPFPEFYSNLKQLANSSKEFFQSLNFSDNNLKEIIIDYYDDLFSISDTLFSIAVKELNSAELSNAEKLFLQNMLFEGNVCGILLDGWYHKLFYKDWGKGDIVFKWDALTADVHTTPTDCFGSIIGNITHVGSGPINLGVFLVENQNSKMAYVGPVFSYYEYKTQNFLRLSDEEWKNTYLQLALRPDWVNIYLADTTGNSRGYGPSLITGIKNDEINNHIPNDFLTAGCYPNPFNPSTIIWFKIPTDLANSFTELSIYDINGNLVNTLLKDNLPSGNYIAKWSGKNQNNLSVSSGVYFYHLSVGNKLTTGKMILMK